MTRGKVKSELIYESKWVIRSQAPINKACSSSTKCWLAYLSLRYSQTSLEKAQDNIIHFIVSKKTNYILKNFFYKMKVKMKNKNNKCYSSLTIVPVIVYTKIEDQKSLILKDNKNKAGVYR